MRWYYIALLSLIVVFTATVSVGAQTVPNYAQNTRFGGEIEIVEQNNGLQLTYSLPPSQSLIQDGQFSYSIDGMQLPVITHWVVVPKGDRVTISSLEQKGQWTETSIAFGQTDDQISLDPPQAAIIGTPQVMRGVRMVPVTVFPLQLRTDNSEPLENSEIILQLVFTTDDEQNIVTDPREIPISSSFASVLEEITINPPYDRFPRRDPASSNLSRMLILYPRAVEDNDDAMADIAEFAEWKRRLGYIVDLEDVNPVRDEPDEIKETIQEYYQADPPLEFLMIIGDYLIDEDEDLYLPGYPYYVRDLEGEPADTAVITDNFYATFDGPDDLLPDLAVGRMMVSNYEQLAGALHRSISYEREPYVEDNTDWFTRAVITSELEDTLGGAVDFLQWEENRVVGMSYDPLEIVEGVYDQDELVETIKPIFEDGVSLALGDGWLWGSVDPIEGENQQDPAFTGRMNPFIVACATWYEWDIMVPFFSNVDEEQKQGPIAGIGLFLDISLGYSRWIRPILGTTVNAMRLGELYNPGWLWMLTQAQLGTYLAVEFEDDIPQARIYRGIQESIAGSRLLGDPSVDVFSRVPVELTVDHPETFNIGSTSLRFTVMDGDENAVSGATVIIRQMDDNDEQLFQYIYWTDDDGVVRFTLLETLAEGELQIIAYKHNAIPYIRTVPIEMPDGINLSMTDARIIDDNDNRLHNGETARLRITVENIGEDDAAEVTATFSSNCRWVTIEPEEVELGDIESGDDVNTPENLRITLDPDCPGETVVTVSVDIRSGEQAWQASFEITTAGPLLLCNSDMIEVEDFIPGGIAAVTPTVQNIGNLEIGVILAQLVSLDDMIEVTQPNRRYRHLGPNESAGPNQPFYVRIDPFFIPGNDAMFELRLSEDDEDGFDTTLTLSKRVSSEEEGYPFGPDDYGYYCFDSGDEDWDIAPIYNWREINPDAENNEFNGTKLDPVEIDTTDHYWDNTEVVELPFPFTYFGETFEESITISYNGWIAMGSDAEEFRTSKNQPIPGYGNPDGQICILWQDILNDENRLPYQGVYTYYIEEEGIFVIEWSDVRVKVGVEEDDVIYAPLCFQILLFDPEVYSTPTDDGEIIFQYKEFQAVAGYSGNFAEDIYQYATIGLRNLDDSGGLQYAYLNEYPPQAHPVENEFAIKFTTTVGYDRGAVSGRVVRSEDENEGIEGVVVSHPLIPSDTTDAQGYFLIEELRVGSYSDVTLIGDGFNVNTISFNITPAETTDVGVIGLTHPELSLLFYPFPFDSLSLQPDNQLDSAVVEITNNGNGPLNFEMSVVYYDGRETEFANIENIPVGTILGERVKGVEFVDSLWYISAGRNNNGRIYVLDRDGQEISSFAPTVDGGTFPFYSLFWDGDSHFWGSCRNADTDEGRIARFAMADGEADIVLDSPFDEINQLSMTYSPDRGTIFASELNTEIIELTTDGEEVRRLELNIPGGGYETSGLGWNRYDAVGKPLYIFTVNFDEMKRLLIRMDPESGEWEILSDDLAGYEEPDEIRAYFGMAVMHDYADSLSAIAVTEWVNDGIARVYEIGPNVSFLVGGNVSNPIGSIEPEEATISVMSLNATGLSEGTYRFGLMMTHNAAGGETLIPVTLVVDENAGIGIEIDQSPTTFDLTAIYPNPFNAVTRIRFTVGAVQPTTLTIYDLSGRKVAVLFDDVAGIGVHQVIWDASEVPSGIYFIRLQAGKLSKTAKAAVMK